MLTEDVEGPRRTLTVFLSALVYFVIPHPTLESSPSACPLLCVPFRGEAETLPSPFDGNPVRVRSSSRSLAIP